MPPPAPGGRSVMSVEPPRGPRRPNGDPVGGSLREDPNGSRSFGQDASLLFSPGRILSPQSMSRTAGSKDKLMAFGAPSEIGPIREILLKHPREAWHDQENVRRQWQALGYSEEPDLAKACEEYDAFAGILGRFVSEVQKLPADPGTGLDSLYLRDPMVVAPRG